MHYVIPFETNRTIFTGLLMMHAVVLFVLPAFHAPAALWALLLVASLWLTIVHWGLIHEAIHKLLFSDTNENELGGRALAIAMGTSFHVLRFGHLMHHQWNRKFRSEHDLSRSFSGRSNYYLHLIFGVYAMEMVMGWLFLLLPRKQFMALVHATLLHHAPHIAASGERFFYVRGNIRQTRSDVAMGFALYAAAFALAGTQWAWLVAFIALRGFVISFMDNIYHFDTPTDNSKAAKELTLPPLLSKLMLHGNYHETHHTNPDVPWHALPAVHAAQQRTFDGNFIRHGVMQFRGPSADPEFAAAY